MWFYPIYLISILVSVRVHYIILNPCVELQKHIFKQKLNTEDKLEKKNSRGHKILKSKRILNNLTIFSCTPHPDVTHIHTTFNFLFR